MPGHFTPAQKKKPTRRQPGWLVEILRFTFANPTPYERALNNMTIRNPTSKRNAILGIIPGTALLLARSHKNKALRDYQATPTDSKWYELTIARGREKHVAFLLNQSGGEYHAD